MKIFMIITAFVLFASGLFAQSAKYQIIVNKENSVTSLTKDQIKKIYTKKLTKWKNDEKIKPVDLQKSSEVRKNFSTAVLGKSVSAMRAFWQRQIFSGKGVPPPEKKTDAEVIEYVKSHSGAIGYVSASAGISDVKAISVK
jgi:ABC-type phosphate transport system substrate-binding protein